MKKKKIKTYARTHAAPVNKHDLYSTTVVKSYSRTNIIRVQRARYDAPSAKNYIINYTHTTMIGAILYTLAACFSKYENTIRFDG